MTEIKDINGEQPYTYEGADVAAAVQAAVREGVSLRRARLSGADLSGADLNGAKLSGANLRSADLDGVR